MPDYLQLFTLSCVSDTIFLIYLICAATSSNRIQCYFIFLRLFLCIKLNHSAWNGRQILTVCFELYIVPFHFLCIPVLEYIIVPRNRCAVIRTEVLVISTCLAHDNISILIVVNIICVWCYLCYKGCVAAYRIGCNLSAKTNCIVCSGFFHTVSRV